jgi:Cu+-exporting ATPase
VCDQSAIDLAPTIARRVTSGGLEEDVPLEVVRAGDLLRVRPGTKVPVDGKIMEGHSSVDESMVRVSRFQLKRLLMTR